MTCIHAQHRLAFERRHGAGSFPYELCTTGLLRFKLLCLLFGVWILRVGSQPTLVLEMMRRNPTIGLELHGIPDLCLGLRSYQVIQREKLSPGDAMTLLRLGGPVIGSLHAVVPEYFFSDVWPDYVYRGVPGGGVSNHAVVCVGYRFVARLGVGEVHVLVLDNHTPDGPLRWILFEAFDYFTCIRVDPLAREQLPRPKKTSLLRSIFSFWK
jgi:hypothetical protein